MITLECLLLTLKVTCCQTLLATTVLFIFPSFDFLLWFKKSLEARLELIVKINSSSGGLFRDPQYVFPDAPDLCNYFTLLLSITFLIQNLVVKQPNTKVVEQ